MPARYHGDVEACATAGAEREALKPLEMAKRVLPAGAGDPDLPFLSLDASHLARRRVYCLARLGVRCAVADAAAALATTDSSFTRAEAGLRRDYTAVLAQAGEYEEAQRQLGRARHLKAATSSARQLRCGDGRA